MHIGKNNTKQTPNLTWIDGGAAESGSSSREPRSIYILQNSFLQAIFFISSSTSTPPQHHHSYLVWPQTHFVVCVVASIARVPFCTCILIVALRRVCGTLHRILFTSRVDAILLQPNHTSSHHIKRRRDQEEALIPDAMRVYSARALGSRRL